MIEKGLVSVIMTNYNTPVDYLRESIDSILNQTYSNIEVIIVDDGSTDDSVSVIESYTDERIKLVRNPENIGLTKSLNIALRHCKGEFVARMDSDDICLPERFEKQVKFLKEHKEAIVCGTGAQLIGDWKKDHSREFIFRNIPVKEELKVFLLFGNYPNIVHPSAMFVYQKLLDNKLSYNENYIYAQDYRMWVSCSDYGECINLNEVLLKYRIHNSSISLGKREIQVDCARRIMQEQLDKLHLTLTSDIEKIHMNLMMRKGVEYDVSIKSWLQQIIDANKKYKVYDQRILEKVLWDKWAEICYYGLAKQKGFVSRIKVMFSLNVKYYPNLIKIRKMRKIKNKSK